MSTCPQKQDLWCIVRGDQVDYSFQFRQKDGTPIDISDTHLWLTFKDPDNPDMPDDQAPLQVKVTFPADANSQAGLGTMTLMATDTKPLQAPYKYDFDFQWESPEPRTLGRGKVKIEREVTQDVTP